MHSLLIALSQNTTNFDDDLIPVIAIVLGISGVGLPAAVFGVARKWSQDQPDLAGTIFGGAVAVSLVSILAGATIVLACIGWLPPLSQLMG